MRRIRERRWIADDDVYLDDWYREAIERRNARRRQMQAEQEQFQTSKTQEDEIREQFMKMKMEKYCMTLEAFHIINKEDAMIVPAGPQSLEEQSDGDRKDLDDGRSLTKTESESYDSKDQDIEEGSGKRCRTLSMSSDDNQALFEVNEEDYDELIRVPIAGDTCPMDLKNFEGREVLNGCAICLTPFSAGEEVVWASNSECSHVFHNSCILHWFHASGRKTQTKRLRQNPGMTDVEILDAICKFPMNCPCCRQGFCESDENDANEKVAEPVAEGDGA